MSPEITTAVASAVGTVAGAVAGGITVWFKQRRSVAAGAALARQVKRLEEKIDRLETGLDQAQPQLLRIQGLDDRLYSFAKTAGRLEETTETVEALIDDAQTLVHRLEGLAAVVGRQLPAAGPVAGG